ncbi:MAG: hypothetical protein U1F34_01925 [Gammaproteobacteria bacterium]
MKISDLKIPKIVCAPVVLAVGMLSSMPASAATYWLNVSSATGGHVESNPAKIWCGTYSGISWVAGECSKSFSGGTGVTLTATPVAGYAFSKWSGACTGSAATCKVTMSNTKLVKAEFVASTGTGGSTGGGTTGSGSTGGGSMGGGSTGGGATGGGATGGGSTGGGSTGGGSTGGGSTGGGSTGGGSTGGGTAPGTATGDIVIPGGSTSATLSQAGKVYVLGGNLTTSGQAVKITASNITLDLNGYTIVYNNSGSGSVRGIETAVFADNITIRNGTILQGAGNSSGSPAVYLTGATSTPGKFTLKNLVIRTTGWQSDGVENGQGYALNGTTIDHCFIELKGGTDAIDGAGADPIGINARSKGGMVITNNILVGGHRGMQLALTDGTVSDTARSDVSGNLIQQQRSPGSKAPYGILLAKAHNVDIHDNQIVSDDGRGINVDGWEDGTSTGAAGNKVFNNVIDVQYNTLATSGAYVENNVYGIRDRYGSGNNSFTGNTIMVANSLSGDLMGVFIGSDSVDQYMVNLVADSNTIIGRTIAGSSSKPVAFFFTASPQVSVSNNKYIANSLTGGTTGGVTLSNNIALSPSASTPATVTGVTLTKFLDNYLVQWNKSSNADVFEYVVYKDGVPVDMSTRGGYFWVDRGVSGTHTYKVAAKNLTGTVGAPSAEISTSGAVNGWW